MGFWIAATGLSLLVTALLVRAVLRGNTAESQGQAQAQPDTGPDAQIYRDQLRELERDRARGLIAGAEADHARIEISRRLLAADADAAARMTDKQSGPPKPVTLSMLGLLAILLTGGAMIAYLHLGAPGFPDMPLEARIAAAEQARATRPAQATAEALIPPSQTRPSPEHQALITRLRDAVARRPDDLAGHTLLARSEAQLGRFAAAHAAQARVLALKGAAATATDRADYAELLILAAGGYVSPEAEQALEQALAIDPEHGTARYHYGLMLLQTGRPDLAFRLWAALLQDSPPDAPWTGPVRARIEQVARRAGVRYTPPETAAGAGE